MLIDEKSPEIDNIIPRNNATYDINSFNDFEIIVKDNFSGVNQTPC